MLNASAKEPELLSAKALANAFEAVQRAEIKMPATVPQLLLTRSVTEFVNEGRYGDVAAALSPNSPEDARVNIVGGIWLLSDERQRREQDSVLLKAADSSALGRLGPWPLALGPWLGALLDLDRPESSRPAIRGPGASPQAGPQGLRLRAPGPVRGPGAAAGEKEGGTEKRVGRSKIHRLH